jgi:purine nucleosidase
MSAGIVIMGGSLQPVTDDPEFATHPRHEFNFWFDPEAAHMTLRAPWPRIDLTTVDISVKTHFTPEMMKEIAGAKSPAAEYIAKYTGEFYYLWDELAAAAWLDPKIITKERMLYLDVDLSQGPNYGDTLSWTKANKPQREMPVVHVQEDLDSERFNRLFVNLMQAQPIGSLQTK